MIWAFRFLFWPAFVLLLPYYLYRMVRRGGYGKHFVHRLGWVPKTPIHPKKIRLWIQAVSVGEVQSLKTLIKELKKNLPIDIYLTTTTSTGFKVAQEMYSEIVSCIAYFPLNFWLFSALAWRRIRPTVACLTDSEFWPEHLFQAKMRGIPLFLLNGRCSDRSFARYQKCKFLTRWLFNHFDRMWISNEEDFKRFTELGASEQRMRITGNLKFDNLSSDTFLSEDEKARLKQSIFGGNASETLVLLGASTWNGEEEMLLEAYVQALAENIKTQLILVPRHVERRKELENLLQHYNLPYQLHSLSLQQQNSTTGVYILDVTGKLKTYTQLADVVFIGKSLNPNHGGQNPIEAAAYGKAIVYGPNMENFRSVCKTLESVKGALKVNTTLEARNNILELLKDPVKRANLGYNAQQWHQKHRGAVERLLTDLVPLLRKMLKSL